jgi:threonine aldolase
MSSSGEQAALRGQCTVFLTGHGPVSAAGLLASIPPDTVVDRYGDGGVVAELEAEIAERLGKPAAAFLPSGTMAQQSVLRVHADRRQRQTVVFHPMCHLHRHEGQAFQRLHGLTGRPAGDADRLMSIDDLTPIAEPPAALLIELPQRDLGGQQPDWPDLLAQAEWARGRGAAVHLDGARLWESAAGYGKPLREIAALFDSVYVSFYKGIGALAGCCVAGSADILAEVREWRHRMGGTLFGLWPNAASALSCLRRRLPLMPEYLSHAREIAATLRDLAGVRVVPDPPQVPMMHLLLSTTQERFAAAARRLAIERRIWTWPTAVPTGDPAVQRVELSVGDATRLLSPAQVGEIIAALLALSRLLDGQIAHSHGSGHHDARVHPAQPEPAADPGVDEPDRFGPEALDELRAAGVRRLADPQHGVTHREQAPCRKVVHAEVQIEVELIACQCHPLGSSGHQFGQPGVDHRHLLVRMCRAVRCAGAATGEPVVPLEPGDLVQHRLLRQLPLAHLRAADEQYQPAAVLRGLADMVETGLQALTRQMLHNPDSRQPPPDWPTDILPPHGRAI